MDPSLITSLVATQQSATRTAMSLSMIKTQHDMDMNMANMLDEAVKSAPQPGQGTFVDKIA